MQYLCKMTNAQTAECAKRAIRYLNEFHFRIMKSWIRDVKLIALCVCVVAVIFAYKNGLRISLHTQKPFVPLPSENFLAIFEEKSPATWNLQSEKSSEDESSSSEAVASLRAALEMKILGKADKAFKLFQHAAALAPKHPDILTHYGEFLEETKKDIVAADQLYVKALVHSPDHEGALSNRQRTASIVENLDREMLKKIDDKRDALAAIPDNNSALRRAKKEAYYQHIYHTVGIEGNTMSLQQTRSILETRVAVSGKSIDEHNEIIGLDSAMKYINNSLLNSMREITMNDVLEVHKRVLGHVDPTEGGHFRRTQVYVGSHVPPGPGLINVLVEKFMYWLNSEDATDLHPVRYAALAHYKFVHIHPFIDGNGRTSRLLMNMLLMQAGYPPVIILKQHRHLYYQHLQTANEGDVRPFVRFIAECTDRTLDLYLWATSEFSHYVPALGEPTILNSEGSGFDDDL